LTGAVRDILRQEKLDIAYLNFFVNDASTTGRSYERKIKRIKSLIIKNRGGAIVFHEMRFQNGIDMRIDKSWLASVVDDLIGWAIVNRFEFTIYKG
jgi:hypothetical protein